MEYVLCSGSLAFLLGADNKRDDMGHGGNLLWVERTDQATPMGSAELRGRLGRVDDKSGRRHLQEEDPLSAFQQGQGC